MEFRQSNPLDVLRAINYLDSSLFGLSIDIFKIRLFITARQSPRLREFGFDGDHGDICAEFRRVRNVMVRLQKSVFAPPYLEDGELAAIDIFDFDFSEIRIDMVGSTGETDKINEYINLREIYDVHFTCRNEATLQFQFVTVELSVFDPLAFDNDKSSGEFLEFRGH